MKRASGFFTTVGLCLLLLDCAGSTKFLSSWKEPTFQKGSVKRVFVVCASRESSIRNHAEDTFVRYLQGSKVEATPSYTWYPDLDPAKVDREAAARKLAAEGYTHVLVSRLVKNRQVETYVPPSVTVVGAGPAWPGYYGGWYPYMSTAYTTPGYTMTEHVFSLETNLYAVPGERIDWSGLTDTTVSGTDRPDVERVIGTIVYEMRSKGVL